MNPLLFSKRLKLLGITLLIIAYTFVARYSVPFALLVTWVGISTYTISFLINSNSSEVELQLARSKQTNRINH